MEIIFNLLKYKSKKIKEIDEYLELEKVKRETYLDRNTQNTIDKINNLVIDLEMRHIELLNQLKNK